MSAQTESAPPAHFERLTRWGGKELSPGTRRRWVREGIIPVVKFLNCLYVTVSWPDFMAAHAEAVDPTVKKQPAARYLGNRPRGRPRKKTEAPG
jgi:hypothetical protein